MTKPKRGDRVSRNGASGIISAVGRGIIWVIWDGSKKAQAVYPGQVSRQKSSWFGCLVWIAVPLILTGMVAYGYTQTT